MRVIRAVAERKYHDDQRTYGLEGATVVNKNGIIQIMTAVPQGILDTTRIGDKVTGTSLEFRIVSCALSNIAFFWQLRCIIFLWKDDTTPNVGNIIDTYDIPSSDSLEFPSLWH